MESDPIEPNEPTTQLVFQSDRDGNYEIYVMGSDGSNPVRLTQNPAADGFAKWAHPAP
jgi:Tol biopolymer transport system component